MSGEIKEKFLLGIIIMCLIIMFLYSFLREKFGIPTGEILKIGSSEILCDDLIVEREKS